jgi:hypothetical protein
MNNSRQDFQAVDQTRAGAAEVGVAVEGEDVFVAHGGQIVPPGRARSASILYRAPASNRRHRQDFRFASMTFCHSIFIDGSPARPRHHDTGEATISGTQWPAV